ncbi:MAG TPA: molecular chaperone DjiA [Parvularculaceae bacterium]|nr:molecular chaperone DjiA [Parvularculaceae bacterium]HNS87473.1 molecular chaperone DjiA [Parvularculaceae bacterium]
MGILDRIEELFSAVRKRTVDSLLEALAAQKQRRKEETFSIALIALSAKMAKADGFVTDDEIRAFQEFFKFDADDAAKVRMVFDLAKQDVTGFDHYADQVARIFADEPIVLEDVIDCLLYIALADGQAHPREMEMLEQAAVRMQLKPGAWRRLKAAHLGQDHDDPYLILGVDHAADDSAVRARYRDLMRENHPDALIARGVPPALLKIAENRTAAINAAYEKILSERSR